ncbi:MAG TPA: hypothetical protein VD929_00465 [Caulobacteraceae bacterium]|nr:hypothetical protein [Caulobacteraceae bacterium]
MKRLALAAALTAAVPALAACQQGVQAPEDPGVCWHYVQEEGGEPRFNKVAENQRSIEFCAARLEEMRVRFLRFGGGRDEIVGAYQGRWLFVDRAGISTAERLEGGRYTLLVRTGDGRLAAPGSMPLRPEDMR